MTWPDRSTRVNPIFEGERRRGRTFGYESGGKDLWSPERTASEVHQSTALASPEWRVLISKEDANMWL
jgi:hypothetical protein